MMDDKLIHFAASNLLDQSKAVWIAKPKESGQDYNDVLKNQGIETVKKEIDHAISYSDYYARKTTNCTLQSILLEKPSLLLDSLKLPNQEMENQHKQEKNQVFIYNEIIQNLPNESFERNLSVPSNLVKTSDRKILKTSLSTEKEFFVFSALENQLKPTGKVEKEHEPEL